jgi:hypothetical protein
MGPEWYFNVRFERGRPVFLLERLSTREERIANEPHTGKTPHSKKILLMEEINKERKYLGLDQVTD